MTPVYANDFRGRTEPKARTLSTSLKLSGFAVNRVTPLLLHYPVIGFL